MTGGRTDEFADNDQGSGGQCSQTEGESTRCFDGNVSETVLGHSARDISHSGVTHVDHLRPPVAGT